ncbi:MAG: Rrf2 family transcriptional regulator [Rhodococcus sp. (in: high G+C Gram-positive bacteria)]|uniref:RrF2 family transcriptional regulator n=1 Tax=Rhodococcus sp. TaxID=1831 RepID=UPI003BB72CCE
MRVHLGRRGDYAVRAVVALARAATAADDSPRRKTRAIADEMSIPLSYLPQILARLVTAGVVDSVAGPRGGYHLARPAASISLLEVIDAVESDSEPPRCILERRPCGWARECAVHRYWSVAQSSFLDSLESVTFADIAAVDAALTGPARTPAIAEDPAQSSADGGS